MKKFKQFSFYKQKFNNFCTQSPKPKSFFWFFKKAVPKEETKEDLCFNKESLARLRVNILSNIYRCFT